MTPSVFWAASESDRAIMMACYYTEMLMAGVEAAEQVRETEKARHGAKGPMRKR